ncbi:MAG: hypothetical protein ACRBK7_10810 [Acidimicrobiales bacterium]
MEVALESDRVLVRRSLTAISVALVAAGVALVTYFAYAIYRTHSIVEASLPCDPKVITNTSRLIDPGGYSLYSDEEVAASKAFEACFAETRELFVNEGITTLSNSVYSPMLVTANVLAVVLVLAGWASGAAAPVHPRSFRVLGGLTVIGVAAVLFQVRHLETIRLVTVIFD